ncbi:MAG TPA: ATP-binding protein [Succinivibrionaceae bacterium]|nr:ATP-binding protein [Succinivibrionaceae bacterium]
MSNKQFLELPYGKDDFPLLREGNCYFVDKTPYLKTVFTDQSAVMLFTRPRRFGKTLLISMFDSFLKINPEKPFDNSKQLELFKGTKILEDKEFCDKFMGQCPVITITLKKVDGTNFKEFYESFASAVYDVALRYSYLKNSNKLDKSDKEELENLTTKSYLLKIENQQTVKDALRTLSRLLYKEYGRRAILLIDEYDVPLATASYRDIVNKVLYKNRPDFVADCHEKMVTFMKGFFDLLKTTPGDEGAISKAVITGCLKVAKNSLFTGVNNFNVCSVVDREQKYTGIIGFTKDETYKFLKDYELENFSEKVKEHYDGYKFCDKEMFCPWDVVNFIDENYKYNLNGETDSIRTNNYWLGTTSDKSLYDYLGYLTDSDNKKMQDLVDGKSISFKLNESMNYDTLSEHNSNDFWSLLLHTGYLTVDWEKTDEAEFSKDGKTNKEVFARIPNLEILECFSSNIKERFSYDFKEHNLHNKLVDAFSCGNQKEIYDIFFDMLQKYVSIRDTATKAPLENYYHGFINGIFTSCEKLISEYHSNYETGNGYPDITFKAERNTKAVIIEIKATSNEENMDELATNALSQIEEKNYAQPFIKQSKITEIYAYGLVFCKKDCLVFCKKLK